jgi:molybdopterin molybdotransferase
VLPTVQFEDRASCGAWQERLSELITLDEARARVDRAARPLAAEAVELGEALGRVLAERVAAPADRPPFAASAMDGFAIVAGPPRMLAIVGEARAGHPAAGSLGELDAVAISTGAPIPDGADAVVPIERVSVSNGRVEVPATDRGANVRHAGEDVKAGELVLDAGAGLRPAELAVAASLGRTSVLCHARPRVAVLVTGDELVARGEPLGPGQIYDSNTTGLRAASEAAGARVVTCARVRDDRAATTSAIAAALDEADVVCISGGVSVGQHDHVKPALEDLGVAEIFWGVRLKPGKPAWFGARGDTLVFGLPGNPVSAMVTFHLFARRALRALQGAPSGVVSTTATVDAPVERNPNRTEVLRCRLRASADGWHVAPTKAQGSHILTSMLGAGALALIPAGSGTVEPGSRVDIELLP